MWWFFPLFLIFCILAFNSLHDSKLTFVNPIISFIVIIIGETIIDFMSLYGTGGGFALRGEFISKNVAVIMLCTFMINITGWYARRHEEIILFDFQYKIVLMIILFISVAPLLIYSNRENLYPYRIYKDMADGQLKIYEDSNSLITTILDKQEDNADVVIDVYEYNDLDYMMGIGLKDDPNYWINRAASEYYGVGTIKVIYK